MQVPGERAMPSSISFQSLLGRCCRRAARPSTSRRRCRCPASCRASCRAASARPGMKIAGRFMLVAPMSSAGRGLVAAAHQHAAVDRVGAQQLLGLHRQEVAVEHRGRLLEVLRQRHRRHLDREAARLPDAALDLLGALAEVRVAGVDVAPGVEDARSPACRRSRRGRSPSAACASGGRTTRRSSTPYQRWLRSSSGCLARLRSRPSGERAVGGQQLLARPS